MPSSFNVCCLIPLSKSIAYQTSVLRPEDENNHDQPLKAFGQVPCIIFTDMVRITLNEMHATLNMCHNVSLHPSKSLLVRNMNKKVIKCPHYSALQRGKNSNPNANLHTNTNANPTVNKKSCLHLDFPGHFVTLTLIIHLITFLSGQECIFNGTVTKR